MRLASGVQAEEVGILGEDYAAFGKAVADLSLVANAHQCGFRRGSYVNAAASKPFSNGMMAVFIEMEPNCPHHRSSPPAVSVAPMTDPLVPAFAQRTFPLLGCQLFQCFGKFAARRCACRHAKLRPA
jgi:hypothetical protein